MTARKSSCPSHEDARRAVARLAGEFDRLWQQCWSEPRAHVTETAARAAGDDIRALRLGMIDVLADLQPLLARTKHRPRSPGMRCARRHSQSP
jgi:hypothetical protein